MQILQEELVAEDLKLKAIQEKGQSLTAARHPASNTIQVNSEYSFDQ